MTPLAFSPACERNKAPILEILRDEFAQSTHVLEIGGGTGQHAVYFAAHLPHVIWQSSEVPAGLADLQARIGVEGGANLPAPLPLDVTAGPWPRVAFDAAFTANTLHIMSWPAVEATFRGLGATLAPTAVVCVYGPFKRNGQHTSESNVQFDAMLRERDPVMGVRDLEAIVALAAKERFALRADHAMPANNRTLVFRR